MACSFLLLHSILVVGRQLVIDSDSFLFTLARIIYLICSKKNTVSRWTWICIRLSLILKTNKDENNKIIDTSNGCYSRDAIM